MEKKQAIIIITILLLSGIAGLVFSWYNNPTTTTLPTPGVENFHSPTTFVKQIEGDPEAGRKIFNEFCSLCHGKTPSIDVGAPLIGDTKSWDLRSKQGMDTLVKVTAAGVGAMPARGGCFECSDEQLREAIQYILDKSI